MTETQKIMNESNKTMIKAMDEIIMLRIKIDKIKAIFKSTRNGLDHSVALNEIQKVIEGE